MTTTTRTNPLSYLTDQLNDLKQRGTYFKLRVLEDEQAPECTFDGKKVINLASNNYLGLTTHPKLREAALEATRKFGVGSGAVRTIAGTMSLHMELEEKIARFKNVEACVVFQSGFTANAGTVSALLGKEDWIVSDELNHASIIDGARLSRAKIKVFRHKDAAHAEELLNEIKNEPGKKLLITDGVFSMDGDIGPLPALCELAEKYGAIMMVDDAHSSGVLGRNGRGTIDHFGMHGRVDVQVGTLSKAIGALGGYVCGTRDLIEFLYHRGRPFLFSTSHPPSVAATCIAAFDVLEQEPERIDKLWENTRYWKKELGGAGLQHRRREHAGERDTDYADHHWRWQADHGLLARAVRRRRAGHGHCVPDGAGGQGAHPDDHDGDAHARRARPGTGDAEARGEEDGDRVEVDSGLWIVDRNDQVVKWYAIVPATLAALAVAVPWLLVHSPALGARLAARVCAGVPSAAGAVVCAVWWKRRGVRAVPGHLSRRSAGAGDSGSARTCVAVVAGYCRRSILWTGSPRWVACTATGCSRASHWAQHWAWPARCWYARASRESKPC